MLEKLCVELVGSALRKKEELRTEKERNRRRGDIGDSIDLNARESRRIPT